MPFGGGIPFPLIPSGSGWDDTYSDCLLICSRDDSVGLTYNNSQGQHLLCQCGRKRCAQSDPTAPHTLLQIEHWLGLGLVEVLAKKLMKAGGGRGQVLARKLAKAGCGRGQSIPLSQVKKQEECREHIDAHTSANVPPSITMKLDCQGPPVTCSEVASRSPKG